MYGEVGPLRDSDYTSEFIHHTNSSAPEVTRTEHFLETRRRARVPQLFSWRARVASHAKHTRRPGVLGPCTAVNTIEHQRREQKRRKGGEESEGKRRGNEEQGCGRGKESRPAGQPSVLRDARSVLEGHRGFRVWRMDCSRKSKLYARRATLDSYMTTALVMIAIVPLRRGASPRSAHDYAAEESDA